MGSSNMIDLLDVMDREGKKMWLAAAEVSS